MKIATHADTYLFTCQVGMALSVLGLGWLGHALIQEMLEPLAANFPAVSCWHSLRRFLR